jgi:hypothetical protein
MFEAFIFVVILFVLRDILASILVGFVGIFGIKVSGEKARGIVGSAGVLIWNLFLILVILVLWRVGLLGVLFEAIGSIFKNLAYFAYYLVLGLLQLAKP